MSAVLESHLEERDTVPPTATRRKRWTRAECAFLEGAGLLPSRYELIDGEIIDKMGQNRRHALTAMLVIGYLTSVFGLRRVQTQATMEVLQSDRITNRPEPDIVVLRADLDENPAGTDTLLAVEVSDTTQTDDFGFKKYLYARAGVPEYWVIDPSRRMLTVFRQPDAGDWGDKKEYIETDRIATLAAPERTISVAELLP